MMGSKVSADGATSFMSSMMFSTSTVGAIVVAGAAVVAGAGAAVVAGAGAAAEIHYFLSLQILCLRLRG